MDPGQRKSAGGTSESTWAPPNPPGAPQNPLGSPQDPRWGPETHLGHPKIHLWGCGNAEIHEGRPQNRLGAPPKTDPAPNKRLDELLAASLFTPQNLETPKPPPKISHLAAVAAGVTGFFSAWGRKKGKVGKLGGRGKEVRGGKGRDLGGKKAKVENPQPHLEVPAEPPAPFQDPTRAGEPDRGGQGLNSVSQGKDLGFLPRKFPRDEDFSQIPAAPGAPRQAGAAELFCNLYFIVFTSEMVKICTLFTY